MQFVLSVATELTLTSLFFFKDLFYFYWKGGYTERRDREEDDRTERSDDLLPRPPQRLELSQSEARSLFRVSHAGTGSQNFGPFSMAFPGHKQGAGWEAGQPGLEPAAIWHPGTCKARTLATRLLQQAHR